MKKIKRLYFGLASGLIAVPLISGLTCCQHVESAKTAKIIAPENRTAILMNFSSTESTFFSKFSYKGISDPTRITVFNNFMQGLAVFNTSVTNIDFVDKTFDVQITCFDVAVSPLPLKGNLFFYYDNQIIEDAPDQTFTLNVVNSPVISGDVEESKVVQLDEDGNGDCQFTGFCISDAPDVENLLKYNVNFSQPGATITHSLTFNDNSHFSLNIHIESASTGIITSNITFSYKDHVLPVEDLGQLSIECLGIKSIGAPGQSEYVFDATHATEQQFTIPYFSFSSMKQEDVGEVQVVNVNDDVSLQAKITNWNELNSTFDVQITVSFATSFVDFSFSLVFIDKTTGEPIDYAGKTFNITTNGIIPEEALKIDQSSATLIGFNEGWEDIIQNLKYTTLRISNTISKIGDNAFENKFQDDKKCSSVTKLEFEKNGCLTSIGNEAFFQCNSLSCDLVIPYYVSTIGNSCFHNCSSLKSLAFENKNAQINIGGYAFANCEGMHGDLSLPRNTTFTGSSHAFYNAGFETLHIPNSITSKDKCPKDNFVGLINVKTIDMSAFTTFPDWLDIKKSVASDFDFTDVGSEVSPKDEKIVYYNPALSTKAPKIKEGFEAHHLHIKDSEDPEDHGFVLRFKN